MFKKIAAVTALAAMAAIPMVASAGTESTNISVSTTVVADCAFGGTFAIALAAYDFTNAADDTGATSGTSLQCSPGLQNAPVISFANNVIPVGPLAVGLNATYAYDGSGAPLPLVISADAKAGQNVPPGNYSGTGTVIVNF